MIWFWKQLMASDNNHADPTFNLTIDPDAALPKTLIITVGFDPLCDEGEAYARQINNSGSGGKRSRRKMQGQTKRMQKSTVLRNARDVLGMGTDLYR